MNFELRQGGKGVRPMSVDILRDSASTRSQRRRNLKGEGYNKLLQRLLPALLGAASHFKGEG
ncbi:hypothetical protein [Candidatus Regiella endosymbiont of Tuberolachnus salignus]|uniref:hypothetical protein n=1 Tax=Candidatus Regiella endosymbiont of Tuberolachnus salignus TaxID=3077956 RepID=UPI0030D1AD0D